MVSALIVRQGRLRWPVPSELSRILPGQTLLAVERRGKYLLLQFSAGTAIWHLGMSGSLRVVEAASALANTITSTCVLALACACVLTTPPLRRTPVAARCRAH